MLSKQHVVLAVGAMLRKGKTMEEVKKAIPYVVLPDAIRMYVGQRQPSHFEIHPNAEDVSWMIFPEGQSLKELNKENAKDIIKWHIAENIPAAVIGESTDIGKFDEVCSELEHYHQIRVHLLQDIVLDEVLRNVLIDPTGRFDDTFTVRHSGRVIDGKELRSQIALLEELGFIQLVGLMYDATGRIMDKEFFDSVVQEALCDAYSAEMAANTYRFMKISDEVDQRLRDKGFKLNQEEIASVYMAEEFERTAYRMYMRAYQKTLGEL